ncbi:protein gurken-like isoform X4 [Drosophila albomicans]|uniref:Protein gurken-like isoform X4 n=1 Tax=Drosophila albomicans TaxID=7291 RepID=A0A6P8WQD8_DROAB|nr:protein gurken-like isoform X4 [Drosophila albomicans]
MQIQCMPIILKVIFVLSTIVAVTDCCSSRILLLRQHTLEIEEHVVQLVNQMELQQQQQQQQHKTDGLLSEPQRDLLLFTNSRQIIQMPTDLHHLEGELASIVTTERESATEIWSTDTDEESTPTTSMSSTTTTSTSTSTSTSTLKTTATTELTSLSKNTMATGEPPPDVSSTPLLASEAAIVKLINAVPTMTTTTTKTTTMMSSTNSGSKPNNSEDISFKFPCKDNYATDFCLNGGNCYRWANSDSFNYCVCADGFVGERCDSKTEDGVYVPLQPSMMEPQLKTAHVVFSFPMLILLSTIYVVFGAVFMFRNVLAQRRKQQQLHLHKQRFFVSC